MPRADLLLSDISNLISFAKVSDLDLGAVQLLLDRKQDLYRSVYIPKSDGTLRQITIPQSPLRDHQRLAHKTLRSAVVFPTYVQGGVSGRSILTNARAHVGKHLLLNIDIQGFFPSVNKSLVTQSLSELGFEPALCSFISDLGTLKDCLPQGVCTSSLLANLAFRSTDKQLLACCQENHLTYTRYVDDITISGNSDFRHLQTSFLTIITDAGFKVATHKLGFFGRDRRQIVTNLVVNDVVRPSKEFISELKHEIRNCWPSGPGLEAVSASFCLTPAEMRRHLWGKANFVMGIDPTLRPQLRSLMAGIG